MKIGIIRLSSLGDVVLATSVLKPLREAHPGSEVVFIVRSEYVDVFSNNSYLNRVIDWDRSTPFRALMESVRGERFDVIVDLHSTPRSHSITAFSGARRVVRYRKAHFSRRLSIIRKMRRPEKHVIERYMDAMGMLGVKTRTAAPALYPGTDDAKWAAEFLSERGHRGGLLVAIAPGARKATKMWPASRYAALARRILSNRETTVVMVGDRGDVDVGRDVLRDAPGVANAVGQTSIARLAALLSCCDVLVSNDSAPTHIAVSVRTPVVAVFGPTIEEFGFAPSGSQSVTISRDVHCRPCSLHGSDECPLGHFRCMEEIPWEDVYRAVRELTGRSRGEEGKE